jgi:hypothetical protein
VASAPWKALSGCAGKSSGRPSVSTNKSAPVTAGERVLAERLGKLTEELLSVGGNEALPSEANADP